MLVVAEPDMMYVASSHVGRCFCENAILVIDPQILRSHLISGCKMHCHMEHDTGFHITCADALLR